MYDIVKAHGGELKVETKEVWKTIFIIQWYSELIYLYEIFTDSPAIFISGHSSLHSTGYDYSTETGHV